MEPWWGFNPRTHAGCDYAPHAIPTLMSGFNPRTHAGCDACAAAAAAPTPRFNPRTHAGCDQTDCVVRATPSMFQSTHPRRVRPQRCIIPADAVFPCFNPRTHAGCDDTAAPRWPCRPPFQSTHPRRVRRRAADRAIDRAGVSIHAPTQGATMDGQAGRRWRGFNPRTHAGCDAPASPGTAHTQRVSIHAPTQGATPASPGWPNRSKMFQSTHPRRVRLHLRARIDGFAGVSIHAPTQGATGQHDDRRQDPRVSIHAPTQGAT